MIEPESPCCRQILYSYEPLGKLSFNSEENFCWVGIRRHRRTGLEDHFYAIQAMEETLATVETLMEEGAHRSHGIIEGRGGSRRYNRGYSNFGDEGYNYCMVLGLALEKAIVCGQSMETTCNKKC